jgi:hypothetical protein
VLALSCSESGSSAGRRSGRARAAGAIGASLMHLLICKCLLESSGRKNSSGQFCRETSVAPTVLKLTNLGKDSSLRRCQCTVDHKF